MRKLVAVAVTCLVGLVVMTGEAEADVGSCYSVAPICMYPTRPLCLCNQTMQCFWACR